MKIDWMSEIKLKDKKITTGGKRQGPNLYLMVYVNRIIIKFLFISMKILISSLGLERI